MLDVFTKVVLAGTLVFTFVWVILAQRRTIKLLSDAYLRLTHVQRVVVTLAVIVCTVYAQKPTTNYVEGVSGTNDVEIVIGGDTNGVEIVEGGTNGVDVVEGSDANSVVGCDVLICTDEAAAQRSIECCAPQPMSNGASFLGGCGAQGASRPTVIRPYRLESVSTNAGHSYAMPADGAIRGTWHLTGAYQDVQKVALDGFVFPLGSDLCTSLWAYTWGKVRPQLKNSSNEIAAVGAPMSAIPEVSRFWTAATSNDTYLLTWENFAVGRVTTNDFTNCQQSSTNDQLLSAQLELFRSGNFIARSNGVERLYSRVVPGVETEGYGPHGVDAYMENADAYYTIDLVVSNADARVVFIGDGPSNLPDPNFIARANDTNTVELLIGKTYEIKCDLPFRVVDSSDWRVDVWQRSPKSATVVWPVGIYMDYGHSLMSGPLLAPRLGSPSGGPWLRVDPDWLNGTVSMPTNVCCGVSGTGGDFELACRNGGCGCGGCEISGSYAYEGYTITFGGWECGCHPHEEDPDDPPPPVGVSAFFTKSVIFLEDEHTTSPSNTVPWHSDTSSLCCSAWGGERGGHVSITITGDSNLIQLGGRTLPLQCNLAPYETISFTNIYRAASESERYEEIEVTATFDENDTDWSETVTPKATAVRVEVKPAVGAPANPDACRHKLGVGEDVDCKCYPETAPAIWTSRVGSWKNSERYVCPLAAATDPVSVACGGESYTPHVTVVEPSGIETRNPRCVTYGAQPGRAGWVGLRQDYYVLPLDVSFTGIDMEEVPSTDGARDGYFNRSAFDIICCHSRANGAGEWCDIDENNKMGIYDTASITMELMRVNAAGEFTENTNCCWTAGWIAWAVPFGWAAADASDSNGSLDQKDNVEPIGQFDPHAGHRFEITSEGDVTVRKFGNSAERLITGQLKLNGEIWGTN